MCRIFLFFVSIEIYQFYGKERFFRTVKRFIFKKFLHIVLKILSAQISWSDYFFEKYFFQGLAAFFTTEKPLIWAPFFPQKINFILFKDDYLILVYY